MTYYFARDIGAGTCVSVIRVSRGRGDFVTGFVTAVCDRLCDAIFGLVEPIWQLLPGSAKLLPGAELGPIQNYLARLALKFIHIALPSTVT